MCFRAENFIAISQLLTEIRVIKLQDFLLFLMLIRYQKLAKIVTLKVP